MNSNAIDLQSEIQQLKLELESAQQQLEKESLRADYENYLVSQVLEHAAQRNASDLENIEYSHRACGYFDSDIFLTARSPYGSFYSLLGDFNGQGLAAAVGAMPIAEIFFSMAAKGLNLGEMVSEMNSTLKCLLPEGMSFSATVMEQDSKGDRVHLWSGGMHDVLLFEQSKNSSRRLSYSRPAMGVNDPAEFDASYSRLYCRQGDSFLMYSDGLVNARSPEGDEFGIDRLQSMFERGPKSLGIVMGTFDSFIAESPQNDDISAALIVCGNP